MISNGLIALRQRKTLKKSARIKAVEVLSRLFGLCFNRCRRTEKEWYYLKATNRLRSELDIRRFIKSVRTLRSSLTLLTSYRERRLVHMQSDRNVVQLRERDKAILLKPMELQTYADIAKLHGDSSEFDSEEHV
jgi:hypothetical protein